MGPFPGYYVKCVKACKTQRSGVMTKQNAPFPVVHMDQIHKKIITINDRSITHVTYSQ